MSRQSSKETGIASLAPTSAPEPRRFKRRKGTGETVGVLIRLTHEQWRRLHELALSEGSSLQEAGIIAFSKLFEEKGLPPF